MTERSAALASPVQFWLICCSTERLDEMLASQESVLRSQPSEADYRAATVKQRPTSRRITPAEISVSATYTLQNTGRWQKLLLCIHTELCSRLTVSIVLWSF